MLYYTMIHPYYEYCNIVWAAEETTNLILLMITQKKILLIVHKLKLNAQTTPLYVTESLSLLRQ